MFIPQKTVSIHSKPYWCPALTTLSNEALEAKERFKQRSTPRNKATLTESIESFKKALIKEKNEWIRDRLAALNTKDCTQFWRKYKRVFGAKTDNFICNLKDCDLLVTSEKDKEELLFNTFFTGKHLQNQPNDREHEMHLKNEFSKIKNVSSKSASSYNEDDPLSNPISTDEIKAAIERQETNDKSCDADNIHPIILKHIKANCLHVLQTIFNWCMSTGNWLWKTSDVTFLRKEGKSSYMLPGAYRPISISSYFGKICERVLDKRLRLFLDIEGTLDEDQEGFIGGRSTTRYLFRMLANLEEVKRQKLACIVLFLDFEKAFDSVHLPSLCVKLSSLGIQGNMLNMLRSFLFDRTICLKVNNYKGEKRKCTIFGLPQGAVLSPLLFILYIADMTHNTPEEVKRYLSCYKFADDGTLMISFENISGCHEKLQMVCDHLSKWCIQNKLVVNCDTNKTEAIILKTAAYTEEQKPAELCINGKRINYVQSTKVLGVIVDEDLNFKKHASQKLKECKRKWGLITKSTNRNYGLNVYSLTLLLKTMVLTKLFYAAPIWLHKCLNLFKSFWNKVILKISGSVLNPQRELTELALHLPPLDVQLEALSVKFMCKVLTQSDNLSATLYQVDESRIPSFHVLTMTLKKYFLWKENKSHGTRMIDLTQQHFKDLAYYTQADIISYKNKIWIDSIETNLQCRAVSTNKETKILGVIRKIKNSGLILGKDNFLFGHNTSKSLDSRIMDYIHGSSPLFANIQKIMGGGSGEACRFCNSFIDSPVHQLLLCLEVQDTSYLQLKEELGGADSHSYLDEVLTKSSTQKAFIKRVEFLWGQNDALQDLSD